MIKVVCVDLDGTLMKSDKTISQFTLDAVKEVIKRGIKIVPVTGRHFGGIPKELLELGVDYAICANGAALYDVKNKKAIKLELIPQKIMLDIISECEKLDVMSDIFSDEIAYTDNRCIDILKDVDASEAVKNYIIQSRTKVDDIKTFVKKENLPCQKVTMNFRYLNGLYKNKDEMKSFLDGFNVLNAVTGGANNIEVTALNATKGNCLEYLSDYLNIPLSDFFAVGDTENDISMLKTAGVSCAMLNADDNLKQFCKYTTDFDNDNDGAAKMILKVTEGNFYA